MDSRLHLIPEEQAEVDALRNELAETIARVGQLELQKFFLDAAILDTKHLFQNLTVQEAELRERLNEKYGSLDEIDALVGIII